MVVAAARTAAAAAAEYEAEKDSARGDYPEHSPARPVRPVSHSWARARGRYHPVMPPSPPLAASPLFALRTCTRLDLLPQCASPMRTLWGWGRGVNDQMYEMPILEYFTKNAATLRRPFSEQHEKLLSWLVLLIKPTFSRSVWESRIESAHPSMT